MADDTILVGDLPTSGFQSSDYLLGARNNRIIPLTQEQVVRAQMPNALLETVDEVVGNQNDNILVQRNNVISRVAVSDVLGTLVEDNIVEAADTLIDADTNTTVLVTDGESINKMSFDAMMKVASPSYLVNTIENGAFPEEGDTLVILRDSKLYKSSGQTIVSEALISSMQAELDSYTTQDDLDTFVMGRNGGFGRMHKSFVKEELRNAQSYTTYDKTYTSIDDSLSDATMSLKSGITYAVSVEAVMSVRESGGLLEVDFDSAMGIDSRNANTFFSYVNETTGSGVISSVATPCNVALRGGSVFANAGLVKVSSLGYVTPQADGSMTFQIGQHPDDVQGSDFDQRFYVAQLTITVTESQA